MQVLEIEIPWSPFPANLPSQVVVGDFFERGSVQSEELSSCDSRSVSQPSTTSQYSWSTASPLFPKLVEFL